MIGLCKGSGKVRSLWTAQSKQAGRVPDRQQQRAPPLALSRSLPVVAHSLQHVIDKHGLAFLSRFDQPPHVWPDSSHCKKAPAWLVSELWSWYENVGATWAVPRGGSGGGVVIRSHSEPVTRWRTGSSTCNYNITPQSYSESVTGWRSGSIIHMQYREPSDCHVTFCHIDDVVGQHARWLSAVFLWGITTGALVI